MSTFPSLRKRVPSEPVTGAMLRVDAGEFGAGYPTQEIPLHIGAGFYHFHEGDVFHPGTGNWVFEPTTELPLMTIWGKAFTRVANTFSPIQPAQAYMQPHAFVNGMGGLQAGQLEMQPLLTPDDTQLPFSG